MHTVKKIIFTILISLLITDICHGQSSNKIPTLDNLESWAKMSYTKFDTEVKKFGFEFRSKDIEEDGTYYIYTRSYSEEDNEVILFGIKNDKNIYIEMVLYKNFFSSYQSSIKANKYKAENCNMINLLGIDSKQCTEYVNDSYRLMLQEWRELLLTKKEKEKNRYSYTAKILTKEQENNAYEITVNMGNVAESSVILGYHLFGKTYVIDTAYVNSGRVVFKGDEKLEPGMYILLVTQNNSYVEFLIDDNNQNFQLGLSMETDSKGFRISSVSNSKENQLFNDYTNFISNKRIEYNKLNKSDTTEQNKLTQQIRNYQQQLIKKEPNTFTALLIKGILEIDIPASINNIADTDKREKQRFNYYKQHFFDQINLSDSRFIRTPIYSNKIDYYINKLTTQHPDSIIVSIDYVLELASKNKETYKNCLVYLLNYFANTKYVCFDKCYVHIVDKYYNNKNAPYGGPFWMDEEDRNKLIAAAEKLRPILCNVVAPNVMFSSVADEKDKFSLSSIKAKYTVLFFWQPDPCAECKTAISRLKEIYTDFKSKGIEIVGIGIRWRDSENNAKMMKNYLVEEKIPWLTVMDADNNSKQITDKFKIYRVPGFYLLDENKKILIKQISVEDVIQYFKDK